VGTILGIAQGANFGATPLYMYLHLQVQIPIKKTNGEIFGHNRSISQCFQVQCSYMFTFFGFSLLNWGVFYNSSKSMSNFAQSFELQVDISQPQPGYLQLHRSWFSLFIERN
jgi:hypothetical protein